MIEYNVRREQGLHFVFEFTRYVIGTFGLGINSELRVR
jgi:hypothetical protein